MPSEDENPATRERSNSLNDAEKNRYSIKTQTAA